MRPEALNCLFTETDSLDGVGPKLKRPLEKLGLTRIRDLLYHLPDRFVERRAVLNLDDASVGENVIVRLIVREHRSPSGRGPFRVIAEDETGNICTITYFGRASYTAKKQLPVGETRWVAGRLDQYGQMLQMVHPEHVSETSAVGGADAGTRRRPCPAGAQGLARTARMDRARSLRQDEVAGLARGRARGPSRRPCLCARPARL